MFCTKCGKEIPEVAKFCPACGLEVKKNKSIDINVAKEMQEKIVSNANENIDTEIITDDTIELKNSSEQIATPETKSKKSKIIGIIIILAVIVAIFKMCGAGLSQEDVLAYSDPNGTEVPVVVNHVSYNESFYVGFMDITLDITNVTEDDYRDMTFVALAWDRDGFPIEFDYTDDPYPYLMDCNNLGAFSTDQRSWQHGEYFEIGYISVFLAECTDFDGETWVNPVMEYVDEHKGEKLDETQLAYYVFE